MAAAAHPLSVRGENTSLHVFNIPVTDVSIVSSKWVAGLRASANGNQPH